MGIFRRFAWLFATALFVSGVALTVFGIPIGNCPFQTYVAANIVNAVVYFTISIGMTIGGVALFYHLFRTSK